MVRRIAWWYEQNHALPGTGEQYTVSISKVIPMLRLVYALPFLAAKLMVCPTTSAHPKIAIPVNDCPVELKSLNLELRCDIFEVLARADVVRITEKPMNRVGGDAHVD